MEDKLTGGPAFPIHFQHKADPSEATKEQRWSGMFLRDWFAGKALQGLIGGYAHGNVETFSHDAYKIADAMIAQREKSK